MKKLYKKYKKWLNLDNDLNLTLATLALAFIICAAVLLLIEIYSRLTNGLILI